MSETMTPAQKAGQTNHRRAVERKEKWRKKLAETEKIHDTLLAVLDDPTATPAEKLKAVELLKNYK